MGLFSKFIVEVETVFVTKDGKSVKESEKRVQSLGRGITQTTTQIKKWDAKGKESIITTDRNTRSMQKFQMEHLGVMFAGMALQRTMSTLNSTAREWAGINEIMSIAMGSVMLPATLDLLNLGVLPLFDALTNLPEPAQKAIGTTSLALEGLGGVMSVGGQLALGIASTLLVLEKMGGAANAAKIALKGLAAITIVGIGVSLAIASITAEDGSTSILSALGAGLAIAIGAPLLGVSIATGIALGAIVVTGLITWRFVSNLAEAGKQQEEFFKSAGITHDEVVQASIQGFQGTIFPGMSTGRVQASQPIEINQTNIISGFDMPSVSREIEKNNHTLTEEMRRIINIQ